MSEALRLASRRWVRTTMAAIIDGAADLVRGICGSRLPCLVPVKAHLRTRQVSGFTPPWRTPVAYQSSAGRLQRVAF